MCVVIDIVVVQNVLWLLPRGEPDIDICQIDTLNIEGRAFIHQ